MNRKDLDLVCQGLRKSKPPRCDAVEAAGWYSAVEGVAAALQNADGCAGFDRAKFFQRCGAVI